jgi:hypothetical protein
MEGLKTEESEAVTEQQAGEELVKEDTKKCVKDKSVTEDSVTE